MTKQQDTVRASERELMYTRHHRWLQEQLARATTTNAQLPRASLLDSARRHRYLAVRRPIHPPAPLPLLPVSPPSRLPATSSSFRRLRFPLNEYF